MKNKVIPLDKKRFGNVKISYMIPRISFVSE
jgi:hypothetical protein